MKPTKKEVHSEHVHNSGWFHCPKCGEKISLVKKKVKSEEKRRSILVIDDELGVRELFETAFEEGYEVVSTERAQDGLDLIRSRSPDLVFLDIRLSDGNGINVLREIKTIDPKIVVIMITAYGDSKDALRCMKLGAAAYVTKPFDIQYVAMLAQSQLD